MSHALKKIGEYIYLTSAEGKKCISCHKGAFGLIITTKSPKSKGIFVHLSCLRRFIISQGQISHNYYPYPSKGVCSYCGTKVKTNDWHYHQIHLHNKCISELLSKKINVPDTMQADGLAELI